MSVPDNSDVTLAPVDPALLLCWEEKVRQGMDCSLLLKHSKGKIITTLTASNVWRNEAKAPTTVLSQGEKEKVKKKKKKRSKKRLEDLLTFHQRLVEEKGLPPSRLMLKHAASAIPASSPILEQYEIKEDFKCEHCGKKFSFKQGLTIHIGHKYRDLKKPEVQLLKFQIIH